MLTVCFDAAGKTPSIAGPRHTKRPKGKPKDSPVMVVAGFASHAGIWAEFDTRWDSVLRKYNVPFFHAGDFARSQEPFKHGWGEERKRKDFQAELMAIIEECGLRKFGSVLWVADHLKAKANMDLATDPTADPYVLCSRAAIEDFNAFAVGEGIREDVRYVFEKADAEDKLRRHFRKHAFHEPDFMWSKMVVKKDIIQKPFLGLQAAGWIAWEYYLNFFRSFTPGQKHEERWALKIFEDHGRIPGQLKILYKSAPLMDVLRVSNESFRRSLRVILEIADHLEDAKRRRV